MRLPALQILRAVAALLVTLAHQWPALAELGHPSAIPNFVFGAFGVDLFFVISGFIIVYASDDLFGQPRAAATFMWRRILRIVPLYWAITTLIVVGWYGLHPPSHITWTNIVSSYFFIPTLRPNGGTAPVLGAGWTLNYEMLFYVLFASVVVFKRLHAIALLTILFAAMVYLPPMIGADLSPPLSVWCNPIIFEFAFGMAIAAIHKTGFRIGGASTTGLAVLGLAVALLTHHYEFTLFPREVGWGGGAALIVAGVTLRESASVPTWSAPLLVVGNASYALYLIHAPILVAMKATGLPTFLEMPGMPIVYSALAIGVSIAAAIGLDALDSRFRHHVHCKVRASRSIAAASFGAGGSSDRRM